jgi:hypothetical protein
VQGADTPRGRPALEWCRRCLRFAQISDPPVAKVAARDSAVSSSRVGHRQDRFSGTGEAGRSSVLVHMPLRWRRRGHPRLNLSCRIRRDGAREQAVGGARRQVDLGFRFEDAGGRRMRIDICRASALQRPAPVPYPDLLIGEPPRQRSRFPIASDEIRSRGPALLDRLM